ncbi:putative Serine/threonine-protein phosphatase PP1 isozyme 8 [Paratrimastix pyriformis]|uniref:Serine/threonine-protein phosphatase n=1 Tax=Paratrimastix pyriformis TaxID=342808 RepID=A0ABQ8UK64_9EUKA|nr:putative Serine/threonine-protein phosphatase PP1 isozyme 8 [Paratrimastix pyriformis]
MLSGAVLPDLLRQVKTNGITAAILVTSEGSLLASSGPDEQDAVLGGIAADIWLAYETSAGPEMQNLIVDCDARTAVTTGWRYLCFTTGWRYLCFTGQYFVGELNTIAPKMISKPTESISIPAVLLALPSAPFAMSSRKIVLNFTEVKSQGPQAMPRMSHASVTVDHTIFYLFGESGKDNDRIFYKDICAYNTVTNTWTRPVGGPLSPAHAIGMQSRGDHSALLFGKDKITLFGGRNRERYFNDVLIYQYEDDENLTPIQMECTGTLPPTRRGHSAANIGNEKMLIFGGQGANGDLYGDTHILDMETQRWMRAHCRVGAVGRGLIVGLGRSVVGRVGWRMAGTWAAGLGRAGSEQWMQLEMEGPHPGPRLGHSMTLVGPDGSAILMWGGCNENYDYCNLGFVFDGRTRRWSRADMMGSYPCPRSFHKASLVDDNLWVFGGWSGYRTCTGLWKAGLQLVDSPVEAAGEELHQHPAGAFSSGSGDPSALTYVVEKANEPPGERLRALRTSGFTATAYHRTNELPIHVRLHGPGETHILNATPTAFPQAFQRIVPGPEDAVPDPASLPAPPPSVAPLQPDEEAMLDRMINNYLAASWESYCPTIPELDRLIALATAIFSNEPSLLQVDLPVKIFGDIHGQMQDLRKFFSLCGNPVTDVCQYCFLGDYVDRGRNSVPVITLLFALKVRYRSRFHLLRGNHETEATNMEYGFRAECDELFGGPGGEHVWSAFNRAFTYMAPAALVGHQVFCVHGGLSPQLDLKSIYVIRRPCKGDADSQPLLYDMMWSDPAVREDDPAEYKPNPRGGGHEFNRLAVEKFVQKNGLKMVVRGHEVAEEGFFRFAGDKMLTVFSATNYGGIKNKGAMLLLDEHLTATLEVIKPDFPATPTMPPARLHPGSPSQQQQQQQQQQQDSLMMGGWPDGLLSPPLPAPSGPKGAPATAISAAALGLSQALVSSPSTTALASRMALGEAVVGGGPVPMALEGPPPATPPMTMIPSRTIATLLLAPAPLWVCVPLGTSPPAVVWRAPYAAAAAALCVRLSSAQLSPRQSTARHGTARHGKGWDGMGHEEQGPAHHRPRAIIPQPPLPSETTCGGGE